MATLDFYFDFGSPTSYMAHKVLPRIAEAAGTDINWRPVLLGGIFKATGNASPALVAAKAFHMNIDMARFAQKYGIELTFNSSFPINTLALMRGAAGYLNEDSFSRYVDLMFDAIWLNDRNMNDPEVVGEVLATGDFDPGDFMQCINDPAVKERLKSDTEAAVARGIFGAPSIFVDDQMYFGQDRLHFVAEALGVNICEVCPKFVAT